MEYKRSGFLFSILLLVILSACQMGTATPVSCVQTGCAYPAVCDKNSGQCTISVTPQGQGAAAPQLPGAGQISNNPNPSALLPPDCHPPVPSISNVNSFCANLSSKLGGVTFDQSPSDSDPSVAKDAALINNDSANPDCTWNQNKVACSGPQDAKVTYEFCTSCGAPNVENTNQPQGGYVATYGPYVCPNGYVKNNTGDCVPADPNKPYYGICPSGTHYDNTLQNCADDVTDQLASPCPPGYPYYLLDVRLCLAKAYPIVYDCQDFTVPLGVCLVPPKKTCRPPAGGCGLTKNWNPLTCECQLK